ncbi:MAG: YdeI family protein [Bacteroidota bacterium]
MEVTETFYARDRIQWRAWLKKYHTSKKEIWLIYYKKNASRERIPYNDAVEEALCFGWIDSILKPIDGEKYCQRYTHRRPGSKLSPMNTERVRRLIRQKKMTPAGFGAIQHTHHSRRSGEMIDKRFVIPADLRTRLKENKNIWKNFQKFPLSYKRIRIGWIEGARHRPKIFEQRLSYFLKMTAANKKFGMVQ